MSRIGNKQNSFLNGLWAGHVRGWWKRYTSRKRRAKEAVEILKKWRENEDSSY